MRFLFFVVFYVHLFVPSIGGADGDLSGPVRVIDGDTLDVGSERVRLFGIDAPEADQTCISKQGIGWKCGAWVRAELDKQFGGCTASCTRLAVDRYGRTVARCHVGGHDIAEVLVRAGRAFAYRQYSHDYILAEKAAATREADLHASRVQSPSQFRANRALGRLSRDAACDVKGNISRYGALIFHLPGQRYYTRTSIREARGERWFCSAKEASEAGWRPAKH